GVGSRVQERVGASVGFESGIGGAGWRRAAQRSGGSPRRAGAGFARSRLWVGAWRGVANGELDGRGRRLCRTCPQNSIAGCIGPESSADGGTPSVPVRRFIGSRHEFFGSGRGAIGTDFYSAG